MIARRRLAPISIMTLLFASAAAAQGLPSGAPDPLAGLWFWMRWLCLALLAVLEWLHALLGNWGLAIVALAVLIRLVLYPLSQRGMVQQARSIDEQARLKPLVDAINRKYPGDAVRAHQETLKLYKEHGVNPYASLKGCVWVLAQLPILIALYEILSRAPELRGAGFLWIRDLAQPDRLFGFGFQIPWLGDSFNLLPLLMAGTQALATKLAAPPPSVAERDHAAMQRPMLIMAAAFFFLFYKFPAGLVLYWWMGNVCYLVQQQATAGRIRRQLLGERAAAERARAAAGPGPSPRPDAMPDGADGPNKR